MARPSPRVYLVVENRFNHISPARNCPIKCRTKRAATTLAQRFLAAQHLRSIQLLFIISQLHSRVPNRHSFLRKYTIRSPLLLSASLYVGLLRVMTSLAPLSLFLPLFTLPLSSTNRDRCHMPHDASVNVRDTTQTNHYPSLSLTP